LAFVFLRNLVRAPVSTVDELRALTGRHNLAVLPYVSHFGGQFKWLQTELSDMPKTTYLERVKSIRTALFDTGRSRPPKILMVTSAVPNEGKTALCCALGKALQRSKSSTLILDADLRRPDIRRALGLPSTGSCMIDYLENDGNLKDLIQHSEHFNLDVVSPSERYENASDLLTGPKFANLLNRLSVKYSTVIVNAPPVIYLADAVVLSRLADTTILTVRSNSTPAKSLKRAINRLEAAGGKIEGTVLSMVRRSDSESREANMYGYGY
jgi:capsular exopolysaccharide synthesis family protein